MSLNRYSTRYSAETLQRRVELAHLIEGALPLTVPEAAARAAACPALGQAIPFPTGLAPVPQPIDPPPASTASLPAADVVVMVDTAHEVSAMANVLTPGHPSESWYPYAEHFTDHYLPIIGPRGPSQMSHRLGSYFPITIGATRVLCYKTELHLSTDGIPRPDGSYTLPLKDALAQIIGEVRPQVFLTTGTSGGVSCAMELGDVTVTRAATFLCQDKYGTAPFNHQTFTSNWQVPQQQRAAATQLMGLFASNLGSTHPPSSDCSCSTASRAPTIFFDGQDGIPAFHPIITTDFFEFGTSTNGLDQLGVAVEMDDAVLGLVCSELAAPPHWASVRNLSDPAINGNLDDPAQHQCAYYYYQTFDCWTSVMSALAAWGIVAGLSA
jgi:nucleoside phosphorylase